MFASSPPSTAPRRLLLVEPEESVRTVLVDGLTMDDYEVTAVETLLEARAHLASSQVDLVLLEIDLPDGNGLRLLSELRGGEFDSACSQSTLPVILVSSRNSEDDRIRGFERGCDDYVVRPFSFSELRGRIAAVMRRARVVQSPHQIDLGELQIDAGQRRVTLADRELCLTEKEFTLLLTLAREPQRVFERSVILNKVWGGYEVASTRTLDAHMCRLRGKLSGGDRAYVVNYWGVGYRLFV